MKTLPIRCGSEDSLQIRAIAYEAAQDTPGDEPNKHRDSCPTHDFFVEALDTLPKRWADLSSNLNETAKRGLSRNEEKFKSLVDGLFEFKSWQLRLICFFDDGFVVCTHGYIKKRRDAPRYEIDRARRMRAAYRNEKQRGTLYHVPPYAHPEIRRFI